LVAVRGIRYRYPTHARSTCRKGKITVYVFVLVIRKKKRKEKKRKEKEGEKEKEKEKEKKRKRKREGKGKATTGRLPLLSIPGPSYALSSKRLRTPHT